MDARGPVDVGAILAERNPSLYARLGRAGTRLLRLAVHERRLNAAAIRTATLSPGEFADRTLGMLGIQLVVEGLDQLARARRPVVCANHPSGAVEGLALISALWRQRGSCLVPANDLLCALAALEPVIVPVRHGALSEESAQALARAFESDAPILLFPAGVTAREYGGRLREAPWRPSFVTRARRAGREILPVAVSGRNSRRFYTIHKLRRLFRVSLNVEMALLVDEMFRRRGDRITVRFLPPVAAGDAAQPGRRADQSLAARIQRDVERAAAGLERRRRAW